MARYIDADKLWNDRPQIPNGKSRDYGAGFSECMWGFSKHIREQIDNPAADVAPRAEFAREIFEEIEPVFMSFCTSLEAYTAWVNLKKKYTEGQK